MTISAIIYARASAECPASIEQQIDSLRALAAEQNWTVGRIFTDRPMPMKKGREQRPAEEAMLAAIRAGGVDKVLLFGMDRIGKSIIDLVGFLETCRAAETEIYIHDRQLDTATSNGLTLFDVGAMLACHIRQGRRDRILRGQAAARSANVRFGRPPIVSMKAEKAKAFLGAGKGVRETARLVGISAASVSRLKETATAA